MLYQAEKLKHSSWQPYIHAGPHPSGPQKGGGIPMKIEVIRHYGVPFINNANAKLIATGITHHIVLIL